MGWIIVIQQLHCILLAGHGIMQKWYKAEHSVIEVEPPPPPTHLENSVLPRKFGVWIARKCRTFYSASVAHRILKQIWILRCMLSHFSFLSYVISPVLWGGSFPANILVQECKRKEFFYSYFCYCFFLTKT